MKKMLFLMLFLGILGTVGTNAQVRIGGNGQPNTAAILDLNATDATINGTKGLALPRVSLTNVNTALVGSPTVNGMIVYNTNASVTGGSGAGIYYWVTNKWVKMLNSDFVEDDGIVGNEITDVTPQRGLVRAGLGTSDSKYTVGIAPGGVDTGMLSVAGLEDRTLLAFIGNKWRTIHYYRRDTILGSVPGNTATSYPDFNGFTGRNCLWSMSYYRILGGGSCLISSWQGNRYTIRNLCGYDVGATVVRDCYYVN